MLLCQWFLVPGQLRAGELQFQVLVIGGRVKGGNTKIFRRELSSGKGVRMKRIRSRTCATLNGN